MLLVLKKKFNFIGKDKLLKIKNQKLNRRFVMLVLKDSKKGNPLLLHEEPIYLNNNPFLATGKFKNEKKYQTNVIVNTFYHTENFNDNTRITQLIKNTNNIIGNSFMNGTMSIAETISRNTVQKSLISVLGGGDTLAAINKNKNKLSFTHLSTAGGAFLEFLEGKDLPGLSVLK